MILWRAAVAAIPTNGRPFVYGSVVLLEMPLAQRPWRVRHEVLSHYNNFDFWNKSNPLLYHGNRLPKEDKSSSRLETHIVVDQTSTFIVFTDNLQTVQCDIK